MGRLFVLSRCTHVYGVASHHDGASSKGICADLWLSFSMVLLMLMHSAQAQPLTVDPETIVPLPNKFDMEMPAPDVPPEIARFQGAWIGTWQDDRHILVVERVTPDGHANVVFAQSDSAFYSMNREWW